MTNPAGWFPDPQNPAYVRWWDGQQWTNATRPAPAAAPVTSTTPLPAGPQPNGTPEPPKPRNWKVAAAKVTAGILAAWAVLAACDRLVFGADDNTETVATPTQSAEDKAAEQAADRARYNEQIALTQAELDCRDAVERALVSPATAEYVDVASRAIADGSIVTAGQVDSQNKIGATLRSTFACTTRGSTTTLDYLE